MATNIQNLRNGIIDSIEARGKKFLDENVGSRDFVYERADRIATLGVTYLAATDDETRQRVDDQIDAVNQSVMNELSTVAVNASAAARAEFLSIVSMAVETLRVLLPIITNIRPI